MSSGVNLPIGVSSWTSVGASHYLYNKDFAEIDIVILNTISELGLSSAWGILYVYDTSYSVEDEDPIDHEVIDTIYSSSDYDIPGDVIMAYFACVYENGLFEIEE